MGERTRLARFVDGLVGLDYVDEGRGLDQDLGLLAHGLAVPGDGYVDGRHGSRRHHRNLPESETGLELPGAGPAGAAS